MEIKNKYILVVSLFICLSCEYQAIYDKSPKPPTFVEAIIPVKVNWANSGFAVDNMGESKHSGSVDILKTTFRFFPKNGDEPFERHIGDGSSISEGEITVPVGEYSVIVMNDEIADIRWEGSESGGYRSLSFEHTTKYEDFAAYVDYTATCPDYFYWEDDSYRFMGLPMLISTWSIDDFVVTENMLNHSHGTGVGITAEEKEMLYALTRDKEGDENGIDMRRLTYEVEIDLKVKNLTSVAPDGLKGGVINFVNKVNMRSGEGYLEPLEGVSTLQYFIFNGRHNWVDAEGNAMDQDWQPKKGDNVYEGYVGTTTAKFISLGRNIGVENEKYGLDLDFIFIDGSIKDDSKPLIITDDLDGTTKEYTTPIDVTEQVLMSHEGIPDNFLGIPSMIRMSLGTIELDFVDGDISVDDWGDDDIIPLK